MARLATCNVRTSLKTFSEDWSVRTTSVNYAPEKGEMAGELPERFYWRFTKKGKRTLMLPQMPGPHIVEVRLVAKAIRADPLPKGKAGQLKGYIDPRYIQYWYEVEYYMHPFGPVVDLAEFPTKVDYMKIVAGDARQEFGAADPADERPQRPHNWNAANNLGRLQILPSDGLTLGPTGSSWNGAPVPNRRVLTSPRRVIGQREHIVPNQDSLAEFDPFVFDAALATTVAVEIRFRPGMGVGKAPGRPRQMIPLGETAEDTLKAVIPVNLVTGAERAISWQISDPRLSSHLDQWEAGKEGPGAPEVVGTSGTTNRNEPAEGSSQKSKFRYLSRAPAAAAIAGYQYDRPDEYHTASRVSSPGYWSFIHTGIQARQPWRTLDLGSSNAQASPPDWLLLDLIGATYPMAHDQWKIDATLPDEFSTASFMNSTAGQVNLNTRIYPDNDWFRPPERRKPLAAVFQHLRASRQIDDLLDEVREYQRDGKSFDYVGRIADLPSFAGDAATQWEREALLRNMAGCLTTKSNTFGVWGVSQVVKKVPKNQIYDHFEQGDRVLAEKRFYALIERYIWPGRDGVPGNAHTDDAAKWDRLANQSSPIKLTDGITDTLFQLPGSPPLMRAGAGQDRLALDLNGSYPEFDGPEKVGMDLYTEGALGGVRYRSSSLEAAYNPPQAVTKYRVVYFKYLDQ
jgi:hypothetical protein